MRKKWLALALSMAMVVGSITGCGGSDSNKDASNSSKSNDSAKVETVADGGGKVLNIYVWNTEFKERFEKYYPDYNKDTQSIGDVKVKFVTNTNEGGVYQKKLDAALKKQDSASADDKIDMFLCEMDYVNKYTNTDMALDIKSLGLTDDDLSQMYDYTKQAATKSDGTLRAVSWQGCPGGFVYRRSIAKEVFGTDDIEKIQEQVSDWDKFAAAAETLKGKGYKMLSGYDDALRVYSNNVSQKCVNDEGVIQILTHPSKNGLTQQKSILTKVTTTEQAFGLKSGLLTWAKIVKYLVTSCLHGALTSPWQKDPVLRKMMTVPLHRAEVTVTGL